MSQDRLAHHIGAQIKRLRERRGWTQTALADKVDLHRVSLAQLERGAKRPSLDMLERLAKALDIEVRDFLPASKRRQSKQRR